MLNLFKTLSSKTNKLKILLLQEFDNERFTEFIERKRMKREEVILFFIKGHQFNLTNGN